MFFLQLNSSSGLEKDAVSDIIKMWKKKNDFMHMHANKTQDENQTNVQTNTKEKKIEVNKKSSYKNKL